MPKGVLSFKLPEECEEFLDAQNGTVWRVVACQIDERLRAEMKHGQLPKEKAKAFEEVRAMLHDLLADYELSL